MAFAQVSEIMLPIELKQETTEVVDFLSGLNPEERRTFKTLLLGAKFAMSLRGSNTREEVDQPRKPPENRPA